MDIGTVIGVTFGIALVLISILLGGSLQSFVNAPGLLIVVGGTFAATFVAFPIGSVIKAIKSSIGLIFPEKTDSIETVRTLITAAEVYRKDGPPALERLKTADPFMKLAFQLVADGYKASDVGDLLRIEQEATLLRREESQAILEKMGDLAPAWGMIGTLVGLVIMLINLSDPSSIGPAMAVALLTTFYGAVLANLLFLPGANKLAGRAVKEQINMRLIVEGAAAIARNENPRQVQQRLMGFMPPEVRSQIQAKRIKAGKKK